MSECNSQGNEVIMTLLLGELFWPGKGWTADSKADMMDMDFLRMQRKDKNGKKFLLSVLLSREICLQCSLLLFLIVTLRKPCALI